MRTSIQSLLSGKTKGICLDILSRIEEGLSPSEFIHALWNVYQRSGNTQPSVNGRIFEYAIAETLAVGGIKPFYYQAKAAFVPNADFDFILYKPVRPVVLSVKTSLRERCKQADLEGAAIKSVHRQARSILITLDRGEARRVVQKIADGEVSGLDACLVADLQEFDDFISNLSKEKFTQGKNIKPIDGQLCV